MLAFGVIVCQIIFWYRAFIGVRAVLAAGGAVFLLAVLAFDRRRFWAPLATPMLVQMPFAIVAGLLN